MKSIAAVERDTGIGKDTLRVWERRYGFPLPERDTNGERVYPPDQVAKLRLLKRLIDRGHRPGKIIQQDFAELQVLAQGSGGMEGAATTPPVSDELVVYLELCRLHKTEELRRALTQVMMRVGLQQFVLDILAPLTTAVGDYWAQGRLEVFEEHLYSEVVQNILRGGIAAIPPVRVHADTDARPRVLFTTFPQEQHALGLLMAEVMFAMEGARCVSLGVQTPIADIASAAQGCDIVALSFSTAMNVNQVLEGLSELAAALSPQTEIWAGGESPALARCVLPAFRRVELTTVAHQIALWRSARAA